MSLREVQSLLLSTLLSQYFVKNMTFHVFLHKKIQSHYGSGLIHLNGFGLFVDVFLSTDYHQSLGGGTDTLA